MDTLEEELLSVVNSLSPSSNGSATGKDKEVEEREEEEPPEEDGWMEVGRRNRMVVTRTVNSPFYCYKKCCMADGGCRSRRPKALSRGFLVASLGRR